MTAVGAVNVDKDKQTNHSAEILGRYAALAFCRADILIQISKELVIKFCSGPSEAFFGKSGSGLKDTDFLDIIHENDRARVRDILLVQHQDARIDDLIVRAVGSEGKETEIAISGYRVPDFDNDFFIAIKIAPKKTVVTQHHPEDVDDETGVLNGDAFVDTAAERVREYQAAGGKPKMSMINIGDLADAGIEQGSHEEGEVLKAIGEVLNTESLGGDTAGRLDDGSFSLIHDENVAPESLSEKISNALASTAPEAKSLMPQVATVDADASGMDDQQLAKAMLYSLQEFTKSGEVPDGDLSTILQKELERNVREVERFRAICQAGAFDLVYMPVCRLHNETVHHYEALTRFHENAGASPFQLITLAEEVGIISEFDFAVAERAVHILEQAKETGDCTPVAINVSGHSISDPDFCRELSGLLSVRFGMEEFLSLEITESAEIQDLQGVNAAIQEFRRLGYIVALDDFGAGAASFDYLNSFDVDTVKFDGPVVKRAVGTKKGKAFLKSMATLCKEIGVETIAEMVEDKPLADFLESCGIELGQGWYFGKPMQQKDAFPSVPIIKPDTGESLSLLERLNSGQA